MPILYYVHDPMCSWCWGFRRTWEKVQSQLPETLEVNYLVGGLAPDSDQIMPQDLQNKLPQIWQTIQAKIPGTEFNYDFWTKCQPRRSTYPACRAVLTAKSLDASKEEAMIVGIQQAYYLKAQNPSDLDTLEDVAESIGLNKADFTKTISSQAIQNQLVHDIHKGQRIGANGFPSLVMQLGEGSNTQFQYIPIDYNNASSIVENVTALI